MPRHYIYRVDHDLGFAPNVDYGICTLCGCKMNTIERWVKQGSWVIGVGGNNTGKPNKLIYAMEVEETLPYVEFRKRYKRKSKYLRGKPIDSAANALLSKKFYYFGDQAIDLPKDMQHIIIDRQGCKRVLDEDVAKLKKFLSKSYNYGRHGKPNNGPMQNRTRC